jgi:hypothetical protein
VRKKLLDLVGAGERDGGREQFFALPDVFGKDGLIHRTQREASVVATHLRVERRIFTLSGY